MAEEDKKDDKVEKEEQLVLTFPIAVSDLEKISTDVIIKFGSYCQEDENTKEPIEWQVLKVENDRVLLTTLKGLDAQPFHTEYTPITWHTCSLRKWLNEDFLNNAFTKEEQENILTTELPISKNALYEAEPLESTEDKIFLLSDEEVESLFKNYVARQLLPTKYAISRGASPARIKLNEKEMTLAQTTEPMKTTCWWWLRTNGGFKKTDKTVKELDSYCSVEGITIYGEVNNYGYGVADIFIVPRASLWLKLK